MFLDQRLANEGYGIPTYIFLNWKKRDHELLNMFIDVLHLLDRTSYEFLLIQPWELHPAKICSLHVIT